MSLVGDKALDYGLENYDTELVRCLHSIQKKREEVHQQILKVGATSLECFRYLLSFFF